MRTPIKLNTTYWPKYLTAFLPSTEDPRILNKMPVDSESFSNAVSVFKFATTFKTTQKNRYPLSVQLMSTIDFPVPPVVLDIGASDGSTSLGVMNHIPIRHYYITDLHLEVSYRRHRNRWYFYDYMNTCILIVSDKWVIYPDCQNAFFPFTHLVKRIFSRRPSTVEFDGKIRLIHPEVMTLQEEKAITIRQYNIFDKWTGEKADFIIVANIINNLRSEALPKALSNIFEAINLPGRIIVIENTEIERSTIFFMTEDHLRIEHQVNKGSQLQEMILKAFMHWKSTKPQLN